MELSETNWNDSGKSILQNGVIVMYSGIKEVQKHEHAVGFILREETVIDLKGIPESIIMATFNANFRNITIINVYPPHKQQHYRRETEYIINNCR